MTTLFIPVTRQRLEKAFGNYPDIIRAWEQLQGLVGGTAANSSLTAIAELSAQLAAAEIAAFLHAQAATSQAAEYSQALQQENATASQVSQLRAEVGQLRELIEALEGRP